jgi:hypothetical protein
MRAVPTVAEPYITSRRIDGNLHYYDVPGQTTAPYSGGASGSGRAPISNAPQTINVYAFDSESLHDYLQRNSRAVGEALATHLQNHEGRASNAIRFVASNN